MCNGLSWDPLQLCKKCRDLWLDLGALITGSITYCTTIQQCVLQSMTLCGEAGKKAIKMLLCCLSEVIQVTAACGRSCILQQRTRFDLVSFMLNVAAPHGAHSGGAQTASLMKPWSQCKVRVYLFIYFLWDCTSSKQETETGSLSS